MFKIRGILAGYKTYIVGGIAIVSAVGAWLYGDISFLDAAKIAVPAALGMTVRHGITTDAAKSAVAVATLTQAMPPSEQEITDALNSAQLKRVATKS